MSEQPTEISHDDMQRAAIIADVMGRAVANVAAVVEGFARIQPPALEMIRVMRRTVRHTLRAFARYDAERRYAALSPRQRKDALRRRQKGIGTA